MAHRPRHGSLQFYPRVRAKHVLPSVRWTQIKRKDTGLLGFIGYKVGMTSVYLKDNTANSMTKGQRVIIPATIIECPTMRILSVRFYKNKKVLGEVMAKNLDKELKRKIKLAKKEGKKIEDFENSGFDDIRINAYSQVKKTGVKKAPDIHEIGLSGSLSDKLNFVKNNFSKEISIKEVFPEGIIDIRGLTTGRGLKGPTQRFHLTLRSHKAEKGQRFHGSGGPWHPSRVEFTQPMAGQLGYFSRVVYNNKIIIVSNITEKNINQSHGFKNYGNIRSDYMIVQGSVQGPSKRQLLLTQALRPNKKHTKKSYEFIELR